MANSSGGKPRKSWIVRGAGPAVTWVRPRVCQCAETTRIARGRGREELATQFGLFIVLNLALTFAIPGISIGGHLGGLIGGGVAALLLVGVERQAPARVGTAFEVGGLLLLAIGALAGAMVAANSA